MQKKEVSITLDARMINMSGIGRVVQALITVLLKNFSNVTLLGSTNDLKNYNSYPNLKIIKFEDPIYSIKEQINIVRKTPKCDVFISPHYNAPLYLPQAKKKVVIIHDTNHLVFKDQFSFIKNIYAKIFYKVATGKDLIFTISNFSKAEIVNYTRCNPCKVIVAKLSIDKNYFEDLKVKIQKQNFSEKFGLQSNNYILYIGNIKPHKNLKRALLAFKIASGDMDELRFLIVGKRDNFVTADDEIDELVKTDPILNDRVNFTGQVSDLHLAYLYKNAQVFLFPSLYEGFGLPPLEAMFFDCPVIVSREGSLPEICGDAAYYCDAFDVNDISAAITEVIANKELRTSLINKGHIKVNEYDWSYFASTVKSGLVSLIDTI